MSTNFDVNRLESAQAYPKPEEPYHYTSEPLDICAGCGEEIEGIPEYYKGKPYHSYCFDNDYKNVVRRK